MNLREEISNYVRKTNCWELADIISYGVIELIDKKIAEEMAARYYIRDGKTVTEQEEEQRLEALKLLRKMLSK